MTSVDGQIRQPAVSVVIPTFNRAQLVVRAIRSVLAQTLADFEIIVVDDASEDDTAATVEEVGDRRISFLRHESNLGGSAARNTGIRASRGEYIAFLDSDDEWLPTQLERQIEKFERCDSRVALVCTWAHHVTADGRVLPQRVERSSSLYRRLLLRNIIGGTSVAMAKRSVLEEIGGFDERLPAKQDVDLWLRILANHDVAFVPEHLVRIHKSRTANRITLRNDSKLLAREIFYDKHRVSLEQAGVAHLFLRRTAQLYLSRLQDPARARLVSMSAVRAKPTSLASYVLLAGTLLPPRVHALTLGFKRSLLQRLAAAVAR